MARRDSSRWPELAIGAVSIEEVWPDPQRKDRQRALPKSQHSNKASLQAAAMPKHPRHRSLSRWIARLVRHRATPYRAIQGMPLQQDGAVMPWKLGGEVANRRASRRDPSSRGQNSSGRPDNATALKRQGPRLTGIGNSSRSRHHSRISICRICFFLPFTRLIGRRRRKHAARGIVSTQAAACRSIPGTVAVGSQGWYSFRQAVMPWTGA